MNVESNKINIKNAYKEIAESKGFLKEGGKDRAEYGSVGETQGTLEFRTIVSRLALKHPDLFSRDNRRKYSHLNPELFRIIQYKLAGHIFNLKGKFSIYEGHQYDFEGFSEDVVIPCLWSKIKDYFSKHETIFSDKDKKWILDQYSKTLSHHRLDLTQLSDVLKTINSKNNENPVFIIGGYDWHGVAFAFVGDILLYWNGRYESIDIYKLNLDMKQSILEQMIKRHDQTKESFTELLGCILSLTDSQPVRFRKKNQKIGNCIYKSTKGLLQIIAALRFAMNNTKGNPTKEDVLDALITTSEIEFKRFTHFLRNQMVEELVEEYFNIMADRRGAIHGLLSRFYEKDWAKLKMGGTSVLTKDQQDTILSILSC